MANRTVSRALCLAAACLISGGALAQAANPCAAKPAANPCAATSAGMGASAEGAPVRDVVVGQDEFTKLQRETLLLKKRLEQIELRAKIAAKEQELDGYGGSPASGSAAAKRAADPSEDVIFKAMMQTVDGEAIGTFEFRNGSRVLAGKGDPLPNGMRVVSISNRGAVVAKGRTESRLALGGSLPTVQIGAPQAPMFGPQFGQPTIFPPPALLPRPGGN